MGQELSQPPTAARVAGRADATGRDFEVMDERIKARLQRGVNYNMKVVVRGAARTGKSQLLRRLQGRPFDPTYARTPRIQSANINWSYKQTNDVVKVEVWDVVDKGFVEQSRAAAFTSRARSLFQGTRALPMTQEEMIADASTVDVYRGTHAVVFIFDVTRRETLDYIKRELPNVPAPLHILLLANFYDLSSKAAVRPAEIKDLARARNARRQTPGDGRMYVLHTSMKDCFGLTELYTLLNIPFLSLKVKALEESVARIHGDIAEFDQDFATRVDLQDYAAHLRLVGFHAAAPPASPIAASPEAPMPVAPAPPEAEPEFEPLEDPPELPEYVELEDQPPAAPSLPRPPPPPSAPPPVEMPLKANGLPHGPSPMSPAPAPLLKLETAVKKPEREQSMDDFFDDVPVSEPEEEQSEESAEESGLIRTLDDPGQEDAHRHAAHEAAKRLKAKGKKEKKDKEKKGKASKKEGKGKEPKTEEKAADASPVPPSAAAAAPPPPPAPPVAAAVAPVKTEQEARALKLQEEVDALGMAEGRENTLDGFLSDPEEDPGPPPPPPPMVRVPSAGPSPAPLVPHTDPGTVPGDPGHPESEDEPAEETVGTQEDEDDDAVPEPVYSNSDDVVLTFGPKPTRPAGPPAGAVQLSTEAQSMMAAIAAQMAAEAAREEEERRRQEEAMRRERKEKKEKEKAEGHDKRKKEKGPEKAKEHKEHKEKKEKRKKERGPEPTSDDRVELVDDGD